ncbi:MAG TPA: hypothetical protein VGS58_18125 [Candidatus Sulfopaludibacter sp.]|nr:hypothetical protein [Candidatus Sulfopaludibacter sp.]
MATIDPAGGQAGAGGWVIVRLRVEGALPMDVMERWIREGCRREEGGPGSEGGATSGTPCFGGTPVPFQKLMDCL